VGKVSLMDLDPRWVGEAWTKNTFEDGIPFGLSFKCPIAGCPVEHIMVPFKIFIGYDPKLHHIWTMTGTLFEDISFSPSIDATKNKQGQLTGCLFHGFITNGEVTW